MCNLSNDSKSHELFLYTCICYPIAVFFIILRLFSKFMTNRVRKDDWIIVTSVILAGLPIGLIVKSTLPSYFFRISNYADSFSSDIQRVR